MFYVVLYTCVSLCSSIGARYILCNCMMLFVVHCSVCTSMWMHRCHGRGAHYLVGSHTDMAAAQRGQLADLFLFPQLFNKLVMGRTAQLPRQPEWTLTSEVGRLYIIGSQAYANGSLVLFRLLFFLPECPSCSILNLTCVLTVPLLWRAGEAKEGLLGLSLVIAGVTGARSLVQTPPTYDPPPCRSAWEPGK